MHRLLFIMPRPLAGRWCELRHSDSVQLPHRVYSLCLSGSIWVPFSYTLSSGDICGEIKEH